MIQFNLLPDVKIAYLKAERQKHLLATIATIVIIASIVVLIFLISTVKLIQPKAINDLGADIDATTARLEETEDIDKILTVQSQLGAITGLHDSKVVSDRTFQFLTQITPANTTVSSVDVDFVANTIIISGYAPELLVVNKYIDTMKFTTYAVGGDETEAQEDAPAAFASVVLSAFAPSGEADEITFTISASFDPKLFSSDDADTRLVVPNIITTRAQVQRPAPLFELQVVETTVQ